jgi:hypothetical protein
MKKCVSVFLLSTLYVNISQAMDAQQSPLSQRLNNIKNTRNCGICKDTDTTDLVPWSNVFGETAHKRCVASIADVQEPIINLIKTYCPLDHKMYTKFFNGFLQDACDSHRKGVSIAEFEKTHGHRALYIVTNLRAVNDLMIGLFSNYKKQKQKFKMLWIHGALESEDIKKEYENNLVKIYFLMDQLNQIHDSMVHLIADGKYLKK